MIPLTASNKFYHGGMRYSLFWVTILKCHNDDDNGSLYKVN